MSARVKRVRYTEEEYLALEEKAEYKHEYFDGQIIAMTGASVAHVQITSNLIGLLYRQMRGTPCRTYVNDLRVRTDADTVMYAYPDATIVCGEPQFAAKGLATLLNPTVIFEVLSGSTEG